MIEGNRTDDTRNFTLMDFNNIIGDNIVPNCLKSLLPRGEDKLSDDAEFPQDPFVWVVEGRVNVCMPTYVHVHSHIL